MLIALGDTHDHWPSRRQMSQETVRGVMAKAVEDESMGLRPDEIARYQLGPAGLH